MDEPSPVDQDFERRLASHLPDLLIRAGLVLALVVLCYRVLSPFLNLMIWALILAITLHPLQQWFARRVGGREGLAATLLVLSGFVVLFAPTAVLLTSLGDSVHGLILGVQDNTLQVPPPRPGVQDWPLVGGRVYGAWSAAHSDLPAFVQSKQPQVGQVAKWALESVASIGGSLLQFLASFVLAGVLMAFGDSGREAFNAVLGRIAGRERGHGFARLAVTTIRAVALGVVGVAFIQALVVGLALLVAEVPWAGALALVVLVLGIAQVPALVVILPAIAYVWSRGDHGTGAAIAYTVLLLVSGMADNVLKPLMLGRGVDAPMPVILLGALGGMAYAGIIGMFLGATLLALGYQVLMAWAEASPEALPAPPEAPTPPALDTPPSD